MDKVILYCKSCRSTFGGYLNDNGTKCSDCGHHLVCTSFPVEQWRNLTDEEKENKKKEFDLIPEYNYTSETNGRGESAIGSTIKNISIVFLVLSIIGSIFIIIYNVIIGIITLLGCILTCFLCMGIGEICNLLNSINNKLK